MTDESLWAARRERARRFASTELRGELALSAEQEIEATLAAAPAEKAEKKPRPQQDVQANEWPPLPSSLPNWPNTPPTIAAGHWSRRTGGSLFQDVIELREARLIQRLDTLVPYIHLLLGRIGRSRLLSRRGLRPSAPLSGGVQPELVSVLQKGPCHRQS
jgi:hypothetical protein